MSQLSLRFIFILTISILLVCQGNKSAAQVATDTLSVSDSIAADSIKHRPELGGRQLALSFDMASLVKNYLEPGQTGYEFEASYYLRNEMYLVAEGGFGNSNVSYSDLAYNTKNDFLRFGFNKMVFPREKATDWGGMFFGLRLAAANVQRSEAAYIVIDSLWGNSSGSLPGQNFIACWTELTAGVRVELFKGLLTGWNLRGKFMLNGMSFSELSPLFIAGYGRGDKDVTFDFNFYASYAIRWKRAKKAMPDKPTKSDH